MMEKIEYLSRREMYLRRDLTRFYLVTTEFL